MLNEVIENTERFIASVPKVKRKKYGQFFTYKYSGEPDLKAHAAITRQSSTEGMVLLKNNAALPIRGLKTV